MENKRIVTVLVAEIISVRSGMGNIITDLALLDLIPALNKMLNNVQYCWTIHCHANLQIRLATILNVRDQTDIHHAMPF